MKSRLKRLFWAKSGCLRTPWGLLAGAVLAAAALALPYLPAMGLDALFAAWNVNAQTAARAPGWARLLYNGSGTLVAWIGYGLLLAAGFGACRLCRVPAKGERMARRRMLLWALPALALSLLFLATDSLRMQNGWLSPQLNATWAIRLILCALGAAAEGVWFRRWLNGLLNRAMPGWLARLLTALLFGACAAGLSAGTPLQAVNLALLGWLLLEPDASTADFAAGRFAFLLPGLLLAPVGSAALYRLLDVSEPVLTGGAAGISAGSAMTVLLCAVLLAKNREALTGLLRQRKKEEKPAYVSGKRNKRK